MIRLREIAKVTAGQAAPKEFADEGYPFIRAGHLEGLLSNLSLNDIPKVSEEVAQKKRLKKIPKGTILFAKSGMSATKNRVYITEKESYFVSHLAGILPSEGFSNSYLARFLSWYKPSKLILDSAYPSIRLEDINNLSIPLPSLDQQKKIASILDAADAYRQKTKALIEKYDELTQSLFLELFGDPLSNSKGWEIMAFEMGIIKIIGGLSLGGEAKELENGELAVLKVSSVSSGVFKSDEYKVVDQNQIKRILIHPRKGDLLFSRANTKELVGAVAIVDNDNEQLFLPDKLWRIDLKDDFLSPYYTRSLLSHDGFRNNLTKLATGTSGSMLNISKAKLNKLLIPIPAIGLQDQFAERVQAIEAQKAQAQASLAQAEDLFNSLLQRAFKGELTT